MPRYKTHETSRCYVAVLSYPDPTSTRELLIGECPPILVSKRATASGGVDVERFRLVRVSDDDGTAYYDLIL